MDIADSLDVLLITMPFGDVNSPALGLSLLKTIVKKKGYSSKIKYFNINFAKFIGENIYDYIQNVNPFHQDLLGEWIFSKTVFNNLLPDHEYIENIILSNLKEHKKSSIVSLSDMKKLAEILPSIVKKAEPFINDCLKEVMTIRPKIVGFSSMFQQQLASLALAMRIKEKMPETLIVFGGANCEGEMGLEMIKKFPFIDVVVSGEGDDVFPELVDKYINNKDFSYLQGVITKENISLYLGGDSNTNDELQGQKRFSVISTPMVDIDSLPIPDFDDYFERLNNDELKYIHKRKIIFESSRGCWWGERSHCTFCGLNGNNMRHRSKSPEKVLNELKFLLDKYKVNVFHFTDNILDMSYFKDFIPGLINEKLNIHLYYEVKSNLSKEQVKLLRTANIRAIEPGIESFSTHVLDLMKKGVRGIKNVQLLKWCKEFGVTPKWGIIYGFPGETKEDYYEMAGLIPKIIHLHSPQAFYQITISRFSPNFKSPGEFGIKGIYPFPSYSYIYPFEEESISKLAYHFTYEYNPDNDINLAFDSVNKEFLEWKKNYRENDLFSLDMKDAFIIFDVRHTAKDIYFKLNEKEKFIYILCDKVQPLSKIKNEYAKHFKNNNDEQEINNILNKFIENNLMIKEKNSYLSLAIPCGNYFPSDITVSRLNMLSEKHPEKNVQFMVTRDRGMATINVKL